MACCDKCATACHECSEECRSMAARIAA
jgi:hypothetical protein